MLLRAITCAVVLPLFGTVGFEVFKMTTHLRFKTSMASDSATMKAIVYSKHGGAREVLKLSEAAAAPLTPAGPGLIVIRVAATALNPVDFKMRRNDQPDFLIPKPKIPGYDISGTVVSAGDGTPFTVGDKVFGMLPIIGNRWGGLAEYAVGDADLFAHAPRSIPLAEAAALPLVGLTVLQVLDEAVGPHAPPPSARKEKILIQAAAGGVGSFAVQYARNVLRFREVVGTSSAQNADFVRGLGATHAVDYAERERASQPVAEGMDVVLDPVAWRYMEETLRPGSPILREGGAYAHIMSSDWADNPAEKSALLPFVGAFNRWSTMARGLLDPSVRRVYSSAVVPDAAGLARIAAYVDGGLVRPVIDRAFKGLGNAAEAFEHLETGHAQGKVIVVIDGSQ